MPMTANSVIPLAVYALLVIQAPFPINLSAKDYALLDREIVPSVVLIEKLAQSVQTPPPKKAVYMSA